MSKGRRVEFRVERTFTRTPMLAGLVMAALGAFVGISAHPSAMLGWTAFALFGSAAAVSARFHFLRGPVIVIDDRGIEERAVGYGLIPWAEIRGLGFLATAPFVQLNVDHAETYVARLPLLRRWITRLLAVFPGVGKVTLYFALLTPSVDVAVVEITSRLRAMPVRPIARCPECGYDLQASPGRCPECGMPTCDVR